LSNRAKVESGVERIVQMSW